MGPSFSESGSSRSCDTRCRVSATDGRIRRWAAISEAEGRVLRVVVLADGETVHNAFFDRGFKP
jgi:hypothetical protein